ncbi:palmitoyltransferase for Vac8p [Coemansia sp. RSA 2703]|nr:palmitoyltransferase for Vac8p [Coemansia sp. RSA 2703]
MKLKGYLPRWNKHKVYKTLGFIPVFITLGLFVWSYRANAIAVIPLIYRSSPTVAVLWSLVLTLILVLTLWSYFVCVLKNPGNPRAVSAVGAHGSSVSNGPYIRVSVQNPDDRRGTAQRRRFADGNSSSVDSDSDYDVSCESSSECGDPLSEEQMRQSELLYAITVKDNGQPRYCLKCNVPKPDRAHHCSVCGICVLKMDHHCPWLNNCVGFHTQKAFMLFISYAALYCLGSFISSLVFFIRLFTTTLGDEGVMIEMMILCVLAGSFSLCLLGFTGYHIYLLVQNQTTIESYESNTFRLPNEESRVKSKKVNLFDVGTKKNFVQVFGARWTHWFIPTPTTTGDGIRFPISFEGYNELRSA